MALRRTPPILLAAAAFVLDLGCYRGSDGDGSGGSDDGDASGGDETAGAMDPYCEEDTLPGAMTHFVRLTHRQYDNTVRDLLGITEGPSAAFLGDTAVGGFTNNADQLQVNDRLARDYRRAAEQIGDDLVADPARLATLVGCDPAPDAEACAREFIATFGRRAFRRPVTDEEIAAYVAIYNAGNGLYASGSAFEQGIGLVVEAMLQSPSFLYRVELSAPAEGSQLVALDGWEIAARLSFMLWNSTPDDTLLAAAESGELATTEGIEMHARRLLADPRAADPIADFHSQWLHMDRYGNIAKDTDQFPAFDVQTPASMAAETTEFFRRTILDERGTYADLMTSRTTSVDARLAGIYGLQGEFGDTFVPVELDPATRSGFLTQPGFLAANAYFAESSPIHRGVFIQRQVLCTVIPDPPPGVDLELPPADDSIRTTRQRVELHTSPEQCSNCHDLINAPGFAFENFDALGSIRALDNGEPVNTAATFLGPDGEMMTFTDSVDLIGQLSESETAKRCYLTQWFRYASARQEGDQDSCTLDGMHTTMLETDYDVQEMLVALTKTVSFRFRAAQEVE
jgi:hypothetical protein